MIKKQITRFPVIIGRSEYVDITDIVLNVPAKIDSGAFRSSIHCTSIEKTLNANKEEVLNVVLLGHPVSPVKYNRTFTEFNQVAVTNSFGNEEVRYEVKMKVKLGRKIFITSFTLSDRSSNLFPVLIGRTAIKDRFLLDVSRSGVDRIKLKKEFSITHKIDEEDMEDL